MNCFILIELETERKKVGDITAELEERKKREEEEQKDFADRFSEIYEKNIGSKVYYYFIMNQDKSNLRNMKSTLLINRVVVFFRKKLIVGIVIFWN